MPKQRASSQRKAVAPMDKRERFERAGRFPVIKTAVLSVVVVGVVVGGLLGYRAAAAEPQVGGSVVEQSGVRYEDGPVAMTLLTTAKVAADRLEIPVADVKAKKIVGLLYSRQNPMPPGYDDIAGTNSLPLLAYVAPSGRLVVASSLCEPCHSYEFHIEGQDLVCNTCFTHWDLNTLEGKSGGCQAYPPSVLTTSVEGDVVAVPVDALESWVPRT